MAFKRKVFYLSGFDPRGVRHYHSMHAEEVAKLATLLGEEITTSDRSRGTGTLHHWRVENRTQDALCDVTFLGWDDLVRAAWIREPLMLFWRSLQVYVAYAFKCRWGQIWRMYRAPLITFSYPPLTALLVPLLVGLLAHVLFGNGWVTAAAALTGGVAILHKLKSLWLLRFFIFNHRSYTRPHEGLHARAQSFAKEIAASFTNPEWDEVVLCCHSNGTIYAMEVLAALADEVGENWPEKFRIFTLGHCVPLVSMLRHAHRFHAVMARVAAQPLQWVDSSFPGDGACYAMTHPFLPDYPENRVQLALTSPRFFKFFAPARYKALRRNKFDLHFAYLYTGEQYSPLAYPSFTASNAPLDALLAQFRSLP